MPPGSDAQTRILAVLGGFGGRLTAQQISAHLGDLTPAQVTNALKLLCARGEAGKDLVQQERTQVARYFVKVED